MAVRIDEEPLEIIAVVDEHGERRTIAKHAAYSISTSMVSGKEYRSSHGFAFFLDDGSEIKPMGGGLFRGGDNTKVYRAE